MDYTSRTVLKRGCNKRRLYTLNGCACQQVSSDENKHG